MNYCYFLLDQLPAITPHKLWFAIWSQDRTRIEWTAEQPTGRDPSAPWTVGVSLQLEDTPYPPGASLLAKVTVSLKDVPPPPTLQATEVTIKGFHAAFEESFEATAAKTATLP